MQKRTDPWNLALLAIVGVLIGVVILIIALLNQLKSIIDPVWSIPGFMVLTGMALGLGACIAYWLFLLARQNAEYRHYQNLNEIALLEQIKSNLEASQKDRIAAEKLLKDTQEALSKERDEVALIEEFRKILAELKKQQA
jgi:hypothetical protein